jgi:hypothetical protein
MALAERAQALAKGATMVRHGEARRERIPRSGDEKTKHQGASNNAEDKLATQFASAELLPPVKWTF